MNKPFVKFMPPNIATLDPELLRDRYRELRAWTIAILRGNNDDVDEDALFHRLLEEQGIDSSRGGTRGAQEDALHNRLGAECEVDTGDYPHRRVPGSDLSAQADRRNACPLADIIEIIIEDVEKGRDVAARIEGDREAWGFPKTETTDKGTK